MFGIAVNILASNCNELTGLTINTYVISDSSVLLKDGTKLVPSIEVNVDVWVKIANAYWIWCTSNFTDNSRTIIEFSKVFNVPGRIKSSKIEYLVDNKVKELMFNGISVDYSLILSSHQTVTTIDITNLLNTGINYVNLTVQNIIDLRFPSNPGGISFKITASSEVFI